MKSTNTDDKQSLRSSSFDKQSFSANKLRTAGLKIAQEVAGILFDIGAVIFRPRQPFRFDSGILSPVYVDNRLIISDPVSRERIIKNLVSLINKIGKFDTVAGTATAGIPHAAWIAQKLRLPMVYVRSQPKEHGTKNQVEGSIKRGQEVLVVEDMVSTAGSSARVVEALRKLGAKVDHEVAIYTHDLKESKENFKRMKIKPHFLTSLKTVTEIAQKRGYLKPDQVALIEKWAQDPKNWGRKMGFE